MLTLVLSVVAAGIGFAAGILVGRNNKKTVEMTVTEAKEVLAKVGIKV